MGYVPRRARFLYNENFPDWIGPAVVAILLLIWLYKKYLA